jgi:hypothetical protein
MFYLKAAGFFEQTYARKLLGEYYDKALEKSNETGESHNDLPPYVWLNTPPRELPIAEVKEFLQLTAFQPQFLKEATIRRGFSMDRKIENVDDPIAYLLPEIQTFRETARMQSLRTRLAIAEGRIDDAIEIVGQQMAMANHLCQDDFLVSALVGIAVQSIAWQDCLYLAQHKDTPNLYWAFAAIPDLDLRRAYSFERNIFYEQLKILRKVGEEPRSVGYWNDFLDELLPQLQSLGIEGLQVIRGDFPKDVQRAQLVAFIGAAYPACRRYLVEDQGMSAEKVDAYPTVQTVMLAICRFHDHIRDEIWKWQLLSPDAVESVDGFSDSEQQLEQATERLGFAAGPATVFLPAMRSFSAAESRQAMQLAMTQTVAALQDYAAHNDGRLPRTLNSLRLPAPTHPVTGQTIDYELVGGKAILTGKARFIRYKLVVQIQN